VGEVEDGGLGALDDDLAVPPDVGVVGALSRDAEDPVRLLRPSREVGRTQDAHPLPAVDEHPVGAAPPEHGRAFLGFPVTTGPATVQLTRSSLSAP